MALEHGGQPFGARPTAAQALVLWRVAHPSQAKPKPPVKKLGREALKELARKSDPDVKMAWER